MKAVILARVSSTEQEYGKSLEAQVSLGLQYAVSKGLEVIREYRLVESSTRGTRKEFYQMLNFVKSQKEWPVAIIMHTVDRLQRRCNETVELTPLIDRGQIELHFVADSLVIRQKSSLSEVMMWRMHVLGAETYILQLKENTRRGLNKKIEDGEWPTKAPVGYLNYTDGKYRKIKVDDIRAPLVKKAFELYSTGLYSVEEVWRRMREIGLTNTKGNPLDLNGMHKLIHNPFYYGEMRVNGVLKPHIYPPLIDRALFERCQQVSRGFKKSPFKYGGKEFIFKGLIHCGCCGNRITSYIAKKPSGKKYTYLRCSRFSHAKTCKEPQIGEKQAQDNVEQALSRITIDYEIAAQIAEHLKNCNRKQAQNQIQLVENTNKALENIDERINKLIDLQISGNLTQELFKQKLEELQTEQIRLKLSKAQNTITEDEFKVSLDEVMDLANNAVNLFRSSKVEEKREILNCVLLELQLKQKNLYFSYKKPFDLLVKGSNNPKFYPR